MRYLASSYVDMYGRLFEHMYFELDTTLRRQLGYQLEGYPSSRLYTDFGVSLSIGLNGQIGDQLQDKLRGDLNVIPWCLPVTREVL